MLSLIYISLQVEGGELVGSRMLNILIVMVLGVVTVAPLSVINPKICYNFSCYDCQLATGVICFICFGFIFLFFTVDILKILCWLSVSGNHRKLGYLLSMPFMFSLQLTYAVLSTINAYYWSFIGG